MRGLRTAASFLTRVPMGVGPLAEDQLARSVPWFGVVGGVVGLVVAGVYAAGLALGPPVLAAALAVAAGVTVTGGFHEDGLADVADALGGRDPADARRILKDPTHGTYGVLALVLSVAVRIGAVSALDAWTALAAIPAAHLLARTGAVAAMAPASSSSPGLGASYVDAVRPGRVLVTAMVGTGLAAVAVGVWAVAGMAAVAAVVVALTVVAVRRFGGLNGDVLGAIEQLAEIALLVLAAIAVAGGWTLWWR